MSYEMIKFIVHSDVAQIQFGNKFFTLKISQISSFLNTSLHILQLQEAKPGPFLLLLSSQTFSSYHISWNTSGSSKEKLKNM